MAYSSFILAVSTSAIMVNFPRARNCGVMNVPSAGTNTKTQPVISPCADSGTTTSFAISSRVAPRSRDASMTP
jgi:hypothetical protein